VFIRGKKVFCPMDSDFRLMPEQASSIAWEVDALYYYLVTVSAILTVIIAFFIIYFAVKYRRGSAADRRLAPGHYFWLEVAWIAVPLCISMTFFAWGANLYFRESRPPAGALEINCVARQWMWKFQHPEGHAEINDLHVPLHQPVRVQMISEDVIHSLFIPAFRVKQDVLPGRYTTIWFEPTRVGSYHLFCAEYCGAKHSEMRGRVIVMEPSEYAAWLSGKATSPAAGVASGRLLDELRCTNCHQGGGAQSRCPPLENVFGNPVKLADGSTVIADDTYLRESILQPAAKVTAGYQPLMPTYEGQLSEEEVLRLIGEIKGLAGATRRGAAEAAGKERETP
jgi:cytochrome c oxidase subunit II